MKSYTLENLRRIKSTDFETYNEYDLFQKTVYNGNVISTQNYIVKENEEKFIKFLESQKNIIWWHKQDDSGRDVFAVEYFNTQENKNSL